MVPAFLLLLMVVFCSCLIFWADKHFAPEGDGPAFISIPHTMWFTIVTVSTVGYGDVSPHSDLGMAASSGLILLGVCYMAMPLAIVGGTFGMVWQERDRILISEKSKAKFSAEGLNKDQLGELFEAIDQDGSGCLSRKEFVQLIQTFNLGFTTAQIKKLYRAIDEDGTGSVDFKEFCDFLFPEIEIDEEDESPIKPPSSSAHKVDPDGSPEGHSPDTSPHRVPHLLQVQSVDGSHENNVTSIGPTSDPATPAHSHSGERGKEPNAKEKAPGFRKIQNGAQKTKGGAAVGLLKNEVANDKELESQVHNLEKEIMAVQQEMREGFQALNQLLGICPAMPLSPKNQSEVRHDDQMPSLPGSVHTPPPALPQIPIFQSPEVTT